MKSSVKKCLGGAVMVLSAAVAWAGSSANNATQVEPVAEEQVSVVFGCGCPAQATGCCKAEKKNCPAGKKCQKMEKLKCPPHVRKCPLAAQAVTPESFEGQAAMLGGTLASAFQHGDAKKFVAALPENLRKQFDEKKFESAHKEMTDALGSAVSVEYVTNLDHPVLNIQLWKLGFEKQGENGETISQQALFQVSIGKVDGKPQVMSFGFI